jgi:hypothetical protein
VAAPMPDDAPLMSATLPVRSRYRSTANDCLLTYETIVRQ